MNEPKKRKPRKPVSEETRRKMSESAKNRSRESEERRIAAMKSSKSYQETRGFQGDEESRRKVGEKTKQRWGDGEFDGKVRGHTWSHTPETIEKMKAKRKEMWAEGRYANAKPAARRRVSKQELALEPYLNALGYTHSSKLGVHFFVPCGERGRVPDYVDREGRRVFEYFGNFWHHPDDEQVCIDQYRAAGWECTVLWESDAQEWVTEHSALVPDGYWEQVEHIFRVRNAHPARGNLETIV